MPEERTRTVLAGCSPSRGKVRSFVLIWKRPPGSRRLGYIQTGGCKPRPVSPKMRTTGFGQQVTSPSRSSVEML